AAGGWPCPRGRAAPAAPSGEHALAGHVPLGERLGHAVTLSELDVEGPREAVTGEGAGDQSPSLQRPVDEGEVARHRLVPAGGGDGDVVDAVAVASGLAGVA